MVDVRSDGSDEFGERGSDAPVLAGVDAEFVVASPQVLHEGVTSHDHAGAAVAFESTHRSEPGLEPPMVAFDPVVRLPGGVVEHGRHQLIHHREERPGPIGHHLRRLAMSAERAREEPPRSPGVPPR